MVEHGLVPKMSVTDQRRTSQMFPLPEIVEFLHWFDLDLRNQL